MYSIFDIEFSLKKVLYLHKSLQQADENKHYRTMLTSYDQISSILDDV